MDNLKNDNIYYNFELRNDPNINSGLILAQKEINFNQILLEHPDDFYVGIQRFTVSGKALPIMICPIVANQPNINLTPWAVKLKNPATGIEYSTSVIYVPDNNVPSSKVKPPIPEQDLNYEIGLYYYIFTYQKIANLFNTALALALTQLKALDGSIPANYVAPYIIFDEAQGRYYMVNDKRNSIQIIFNTLGYLIFDGFQVFYDNLATDEFVYRILFQTFTGNETEHFVNGVATNPATIELYQEYINTDYINTCKSIIFVSNTLGTTPEFISVKGKESGAFNSIPVLTDFEFAFDKIGGPREKLQYSITGISNLRLVNIQNTQPIKKLDVSVYWTDNLGRLFPLYLYRNTYLTIKFLFVRKSLFK